MAHHFNTTTGPQRLGYGVAAGIAVALLPLPWPASTRGLLAWCAGALVYLGLSWWLAAEFDVHRIRERAQAQDQSAVVLFLLMLVAVLASGAAIALLLQQAKNLAGMQRTAHIALGMGALACSWLLIQTIFAFRYAHRFYQHPSGKGAPDPGLAFPGDEPPDYVDFLYHAYVVGMTSQVSDVQATTHAMRRLTLVHSVLAFAFNMLVLALSVNVVAGAI